MSTGLESTGSSLQECRVEARSYPYRTWLGVDDGFAATCDVETSPPGEMQEPCDCLHQTTQHGRK